MAVNYTSLYNRLATKVNKLRKRLLRKRRQYEREDEEMRLKGRYPRPRPDFEVPMKQRLIEPTAKQLDKKAYEEYQAKIKAEFGSLNVKETNFYKYAYKRNFLDVLSGRNDPEKKGGFIALTPSSPYWLNYTEIVNGVSKKIQPASNDSYYTQQQLDFMERYDKSQYDLMKLYNMVQHMSVEEFMYLYEQGAIVGLSFIYQGATDTKNPSFYDEQVEKRKQAIREFRQISATRREMYKGLPKVYYMQPVVKNRAVAQGHADSVRWRRGKK